MPVLSKANILNHSCPMQDQEQQHGMTASGSRPGGMGGMAARRAAAKRAGAASASAAGRGGQQAAGSAASLQALPSLFVSRGW